ncbi:PAAR-like protein [Chryseobacterium camelliae]|uniref:PAAR-like protein n=1 Tax=Chryseobacterium camelliae TaxID=1265445 RepID=A0ABY7QKB2_9FLAO|nr:PAAR-like protein [Chryseobacterium camelliae]WBV60080.1 PAAR-like protein [Chryseobacterium camelliae]
MAESFVPQETTVVCTNMTNGAPQKLGMYERTSITIYRSKEQPLLNKLDRKLSGSFQCKTSMKFWGGLQVLCAVLAVGALAIATVATGGAALALVAAVVAVTAATASVGSGIVAIYKAAHDCDATLTSNWEEFHKIVNIEKSNALLNKSFMSCSKGGIVTIIMDPVLAQEAATQISDGNNKEVLAHFGAQAVMGVITVATTFSPIGILVGAPLAVYNYWNGESDKQKIRDANTKLRFTSQAQNNKSLLEQGWDATKQEGVNGVIGTPGALVEEGITVTARNQALLRQAQQYGMEAIERQAAGRVASAESARLAQDILMRSQSTAFNWKGLGGGLVKGFIGGMINFGIDYSVDQYEESKNNESIDIALSADDVNAAGDKNDKGGINIIAQEG